MADAPTTSTTAPAPQGAGGLPQFDASWWPGEMVWFAFIFLVVFIFMARVFVPRISGAIVEREDRISGDIAKARALKEQAEAQSAAADAEIAQARAKAQKLASEAKSRAQSEASARQAAEEARLNATLAEAEAAIRTAREEAMGRVQEIASDTARAIVEKLSGQAATTDDVAGALAARS